MKIQTGRHPYRQLIKIGQEQGRRPQPDDIRQILCNSWGIGELAEVMSIAISEPRLMELEEVVQAEVNGVAAYPDALEAVELLAAHGYAIAVCSNLASPYGAAIRRCFPALDAYALSYEIGAIKPERAVYEACCSSLSCEPDRMVMIGDSPSCDCDGPLAVGIQGYLLERVRGAGDFADLMTFAEWFLSLGSTSAPFQK